MAKLTLSVMIALLICATMIVTTNRSYSREELIALNKAKPCRVTPIVYNRLKELGLCSTKPTRRGLRSSKSLRVSDKRTILSDLEPASSGREEKSSPPASVTIGTFNARTLKQDFRLYELAKLSKDQNYDIIGIQEHRRILDSPTTCIDVGSGWKAYLATARAGGHGGVGFLVAPGVNTALLNIEPLHHRIITMTVELKDNRMHIINCHMPTACATDISETHDCIDIIGEYLTSRPSRDFTVFVGDLNADLLPDGNAIKNKHQYHAKIRATPHSEAVTDLITSTNLVACNGIMRQRRSKLLTFFGPQKRKCRLDYIFVDKKWTRLIQKVHNIKPQSVRSDHTLLTCTFRLRFWRPTKHDKPERPPFWPALQSPDVRQRFINETLTKYDHRTEYSAFVESVKHAAEKVLPKRRQMQKSCLWDKDPEVEKARKRLAHAHRANLVSSYTQLETDLQNTYSQRRDEIIHELATEVSQHHEAGRSQAVWKTIDKITGRKKRPSSIVNAESMEARMVKTASYFHGLLNVPPVDLDLPPLDEIPQAPDVYMGPITLDELYKSARLTPTGKSAGPDELPSDIVGILPLLDCILPIMNDILDGQKPPQLWRRSIIVAIPKGNSPLLTNQRGLSLMCANAKLFNRVLLARLRERLETILLPWQAGFRPGRNTVEQIACLRMAIDACRSRKRNMVVTFVDFSKAFDSVDRRALRDILAFYGIPVTVINAIMSLYTDTTACVRTSTGCTDEFDTTSGVLQGDTLAPYLFVIVMDYIMRISLTAEDGYTVRRRLSVRHTAVKIPALAYADDAALLSDNGEAAQRQLHRFETASAKVGLRLNASKTKIMFVGDIPHSDIHTSSGSTLATCDDFCYLGCNVADNTGAFQRRRQLAWIAARKLTTVWNSAASDSAKMQLFKSTVESVLLYSCEALAITETLGNRIDASHRSLMRYCLGVHFPERISNVNLYARTQIEPATLTLTRDRLRLVGHALRRPDLPLAMFLHPRNQATEPYRQGGALLRTYQNQIFDDLRDIGLQPNVAVDAAQNRSEWLRRVKALK